MDTIGKKLPSGNSTEGLSESSSDLSRMGYSSDDSFSVSESSLSSQSPTPQLEPALQEYRAYLKRNIAGPEHLIDARQALVSRHRTEESESMQVKMYGKRLASHIRRTYNQGVLEELESIRGSILIHSNDLLAKEPERVLVDEKRSTAFLNKTAPWLQKELCIITGLVRKAQQIVDLDRQQLDEQEKRRPVNHQSYQKQVLEIRTLIKSKASQERIASKIAELQTFDEGLREEYEGRDPYHSSLVSSAKNWLKSWFSKDSDTRPSPTDLLLEYSLACHGLSTDAEVYLRTFQELLSSNPTLSLQELQDEIRDFLLYHPVLCSQMAAQMAQVYALATGDETAGAGLQSLVYRKRIQHITLDALIGKKNRFSYQTEFEHPLTPRQIAVVKLMRNLPYIVGVHEGFHGKTAGGALGTSLAGSLGGALGGLLHAKTQEVLSDSLNRDTEIIGSLISRAMNTVDPEVLLSARQAFRTIKPSYEKLSALYALFGQIQSTVTGEFAPRGQFQKATNFIRTTYHQGVQQGVQETAKGAIGTLGADALYSQDDQTSFELQQARDILLFSSRFFKVMKTLGAMSSEQVNQATEALGLQTPLELVSWFRKIETDPEDWMKAVEPIIGANNSVFIENWRLFITKYLYSLPQKVSDGTILKSMEAALTEGLFESH